MVLPVKLVDLGGGVGQLREFGYSDKLPLSVFPDEFKLYRNDNPIINGAMESAQRGTSFSAINGYTLDNWQVLLSGDAVVTASQQIDAPAISDFYFSQRVVVTTADASIGATDFAAIVHKIEGTNSRAYIGKDFVCSFWVRSPKTGIHCVSFRNKGQDRTFVAEYTINAANTWEFKSIPVPGGLITAGTWNWDLDIGLRLSFVLAAGSSYHTTAGSWETGNFLSTVNQVNCLDTVGNTFAITGVQINPGTLSMPFHHRLYSTELMLCQRYYQTGVLEFSGYVVAGATYLTRQPFPVRMRTAPTMILTSTYGSGFPNVAGTAAAGPGGFSESRVASATANAGSFGSQYTASAEL